MPTRTRYAIWGVSHRAIHTFARALTRTFADRAELVALLDPDPARFAACARALPETASVPTYAPSAFDAMVAAERPDAVIVAGIDSSHVDGALAALGHGLDVVVEKPLAITTADCVRILGAERASRGRVVVGFNFRYPPAHRLIRELVAAGRIGRVTHVELAWSLDPWHGASYFKRWHRRRERSGGLAVHKSSHHFDLVSHWIDDVPVEVFGYGARAQYGDASEHRPADAGTHCGDCPAAARCVFQRALPGDAATRAVSGHRPTDEYTGYRPDACVFDASIDVEDTYVATVRYRRGALLAYSIHFGAPYEGYRLVLQGTRGRIETTKYLAPERLPHGAPPSRVELYTIDGGHEALEPPAASGPHEGGDALFLRDLFARADADAAGPLADAMAGTLAVAVGDALTESMRRGRPIRIAELLHRTLPVHEAPHAPERLRLSA